MAFTAIDKRNPRRGRFRRTRVVKQMSVEEPGMADVLLVIDVQRMLVDELSDRRSALIGTLGPLLDRARGADVPVWPAPWPASAPATRRRGRPRDLCVRRTKRGTDPRRDAPASTGARHAHRAGRWPVRLEGRT
jgi:hypothetical protein